MPSPPSGPERSLTREEVERVFDLAARASSKGGTSSVLSAESVDRKSVV
jgi:hypothetical protein